MKFICHFFQYSLLWQKSRDFFFVVKKLWLCHLGFPVGQTCAPACAFHGSLRCIATIIGYSWWPSLKCLLHCLQHCIRVKPVCTCNCFSVHAFKGNTFTLKYSMLWNPTFCAQIVEWYEMMTLEIAYWFLKKRFPPFITVSNDALRGATPQAAAQVLQWVSFADSEIIPPASAWVFPTLGIMQFNKQVCSSAFSA